MLKVLIHVCNTSGIKKQNIIMAGKCFMANEGIPQGFSFMKVEY